MPLPPRASINADQLDEPQAREIAFLLGTYPDVVKVAQRMQEPSGVVAFVMRLSYAIASAWGVVLLKGETYVERAHIRMWLYLCARDVLAAAMRLLNSRLFERM